MSGDGEAGKGSEPTARPSPPDCLCAGLGPEVTRLLRQLAACEDVWEQVRNAEVDVLKFLRALIDARLASAARDRCATRGTRVTVE